MFKIKKKILLKGVLSAATLVAIMPLSISCFSSLNTINIPTTDDLFNDLVDQILPQTNKYIKKPTTIISAQEFKNLFTTTNQAEHENFLLRYLAVTNEDGMLLDLPSIFTFFDDVLLNVDSVTVVSSDNTQASASITFRLIDNDSDNQAVQATVTRNVDISGFSTPEEAADHKLLTSAAQTLEAVSPLSQPLKITNTNSTLKPNLTSLEDLDNLVEGTPFSSAFPSNENFLISFNVAEIDAQGHVRITSTLTKGNISVILHLGLQGFVAKTPFT